MIGITGASGFVGTNLIDYLSQYNLNVKAISRDALNSNSLNLNDYDTIIHLAGKAHDLKSISDPDEYYKINFGLTKKLYDAFLTSGTQKFIFISSVKAVADHLDTVLSEDQIPDPKTDYGKSKLIAEDYIIDQKLPDGKLFYILRPCMIHGPGNKGNLNLLFKLVSNNIPYPLGAFNNERSFLSVENLCFIIKELIITNAPKGVYNVADDEPLSTKKLIICLAEAVNKRINILNINRNIIVGLAKIGDHIKLPFNTERLNKLTENYVVSNKKIKSILKSPLPVSAEDGIRNTALSFNRCKTK
jgi:nucleoside-diphosphate-sugar epimerase